MSNTGICPVCNGTGKVSDGGLCRNCGGQTMSLTATGKSYLRDDGTPCTHEYTGVNRGRCYTEYTCKHCGYHYGIDSGD